MVWASLVRQTYWSLTKYYRPKADQVALKLEAIRLPKAVRLLREGAPETLAYYALPQEHWRSLRTNNMLERLNREIRRRTRVVGAFPDGQSALMLVSARLRHMAATRWGLRRYLNMRLLCELEADRAEDILASPPLTAV
jgi:transposase-like protein